MDAKTEIIGPLRCTKAEKWMIKKAANHVGKSITAYLMGLVIEDATSKNIDTIKFMLNPKQEEIEEFEALLQFRAGVMLKGNTFPHINIRVIVSTIDDDKITGEIEAVFIDSNAISRSELIGMIVEFDKSEIFNVLKLTADGRPTGIKALHLIERNELQYGEKPAIRPENSAERLDQDGIIFLSHSWAIKRHTINNCIGKHIYFHKKQKIGAWIGGKLLNYKPDINPGSEGRYILRIQNDLSLHGTHSPEGIKWGQHILLARY